MMRFEDVSIQLVDLPPLLEEVPGGMLALLKGTDGALLLADLAAPEVLDHLEATLKAFEGGRVRLFDREHPLPVFACPVPFRSWAGPRRRPRCRRAPSG